MEKKIIWIAGSVGIVAVLAALGTGGMGRPAMVGRGMDGVLSFASKGGFADRDMGMAYDAYEESVGTAAPVSYPSPDPSTEPTAGETAAETDQKLIKTGSLDLSTDDVGETERHIAAAAAAAGGYVQESNVSERADGTHFGNVTVRVPSDRFESAMEEIKAFAVSVRGESSRGQDVTEQYADLRAQLRNAEAQESEYLKILARAETVEEILQVQSYLSSVRGQIESLQGRLQYLENRTSYSTISVSLSEEPAVRIPTKDFRLGATAREAFRGLVAVLQNLASTVVWLVILGGGLLLPAALVVWILVRIVKSLRRRYGKKTPDARN